MLELADPGAIQLYLGHHHEPLLNFTVFMDRKPDYVKHQQGRPLWFYADLPAGVAPMQTFDLRVLNWR